MKLILKNARVIDPENHIDAIGDIGIDESILVDPSTLSCLPSTKVIDVSNLVITPGLIDMHVHLREPGFEYKEDIQTGTKAAAAGGFTTIVAMPNTRPAIDSVKTIELLNSIIEKSSLINTLPTVCLTKGREGQKLTDIINIGESTNVVAITDDGDCIQDDETMFEAMKLAFQTGLPIIDHCEEMAANAGGVIREGAVSKLMGAPGMPGEAESNMVARNIELCKKIKTKIHIQHISYYKSINYVRNAQECGLPVTAEVSPHHLFLTNDILPIALTNGKMNPPLGTKEDQEVLLNALLDNTISVIATDHAPHAPAEKAKDLVNAPFGILGLETAIPLCLSGLVASGIMNLSDLIAKFTTGPADVLNLKCGTLNLGQHADITLINPNKEHRIDINQSFSKSRNSPFHNKSVTGKIVATICAGKFVYNDGSLSV